MYLKRKYNYRQTVSISSRLKGRHFGQSNIKSMLFFLWFLAAILVAFFNVLKTESPAS